MKRNEAAKIITANDLLSGEVVYLTTLDQWSLRHSDANLFEDGTAANTRLNEVQQRDSSVVGPYLAGAALGECNSPKPVHFREAFRMSGPSNRFLGKQSRPN